MVATRLDFSQQAKTPSARFSDPVGGVFDYLVLLITENIALFNFSDKDAFIAPELDGDVTMLLNTDWEAFGGNTVRSVQKRVPETIQAFCGCLFSVQLD